MMVEPNYATALKLFGGRKFVGLIVVSSFMLLAILLTYLKHPELEQAWEFLRLAWPGFLILVGAYMGIDVAERYVNLSKGLPTNVGSTDVPTEKVNHPGLEG